MKHKLLVITAGTVAAGVGYQLQKQVEARPNSELTVMVRYLDIATNLPSIYGGGILANEWKPMQISRKYMDSIEASNGSTDPKLLHLLYPGLHPRTEGAGGGGVRYNGAGALIVNHTPLEQWVEGSMVSLAQKDGGQANLSVALIASPVGATGSGSVERLLELIVSAASRAGLAEEIHCDVFFLQPGNQNIRSVGLANTLALYAELAATRMSRKNVNYKGRTIMMGWGTETLLSSIPQLQEATATLVRLLNDPRLGIAAEYRQREVDHTVLIARDRQTHLPSHLSAATAITITLGDLEEQIIRYDTLQVLGKLVNGDNATKAFEEDANIFLGIAKNYLDGNNERARYEYLLERMTEDTDLKSPELELEQIKGLPAGQQSSSLQDEWDDDRKKLKKQSTTQMRDKAEALVREAINEMVAGRRECLKTGFSLARIQKDYEEVQAILADVLLFAQNYHPPLVKEEIVREHLSAVDRRRWFGRNDEELAAAIKAIQDHVNGLQLQQAGVVGTLFLRKLQEHCKATLTHLSAVKQFVDEVLSQVQAWDSENPPLRIKTDHLLQMPALTPKQIRPYYEQVSVFALPTKKQDNVSAEFFEEEGKQDPLADFRLWLGNNGLLDLPFRGNFERVSSAVEEYTRGVVHEHIEGNSVVDVLITAGKDVLSQRLPEAAAMAHSLVKFDPTLAPNCIESRHVSALYREDQRGLLQEAMNNAFGQGGCTLLSSQDPTELAVVYYLDGLPMSSVTDLTGRCLKEFLEFRKDWYGQVNDASNGNGSHTGVDYSRGSIPVYSGRDAEELVCKTGAVRQLYSVRDKRIVDGYDPAEFLELQ